jgi:hypothetical protein
MDKHKDRFRYKEGEERYNIYKKDNTIIAEMEVQRIVYVYEEQEQQEQKKHER